MSGSQAKLPTPRAPRLDGRKSRYVIYETYITGLYK
jgi:hypothetical protein